MPSVGFAVAPMLVVKNDLLKSLKAVAAFDSKGAPYIAVQLIDGQKPMFQRTNNEGIIQSKNYGINPTTYVSLNHLTNVLKACPEDSIELSTDDRGIMHLHGSSGVVLNSESNVHTVREKDAGTKLHDIGARVVTLDAKTFAGLDISSFKLATEPVLSDGKLMLATVKGAVVMWQSDLLASQPIKLSPRETFLRIVCGEEVGELVLTANGYWGATFGDLVTYTKGHILGRQLFDSYNTPGVQVAQLPAERLLTCLRSAVGLLDDTDRIDIDPQLGVIAKGNFGDNRNSLGETGTWQKFGIQAKTASVVIDALSQAEGDYATLESTSPGSGPSSTMRLSRGQFAVNFRSF
jgi:hypothetical protein